ncbi:FtsW/RodA/SpoVE family cell cycle protein [Terrilactibacillus sp. S3-3]|nr:FtsW/RodA/SpoVE family cell cycle protein [Terrilactibacillus sp. S3-3]
MNKETFSKLDYTLIFIVFLLFCISLLAIHNAPLTGNVQHVNFVVRQAGWYMICSIVAFLVLLVDYDHFKQVHWYLYGFGMFLLLGLTAAQFHVPVPFTNNDNGAWSWYFFSGYRPNSTCGVYEAVSHLFARCND